VLSLLAILLIALQTGAAPPLTARDLAAYRLTMAAFEPFERASALIADATAADARLRSNPLFSREVSVLEDVAVVAPALEARLAAEPAVAAALRTAAVTPRDYTTFALALFAARLAHGFVQSGAMRFVPKGVASDNVAFITANESRVAAVLRRLGVE
jgi:hypothetical protein